MSRNHAVGTGRAGCPSPPSCGFQSICIGRAGSPFDDGMVFPPHLPISRSGAVGHHALPQSLRAFTLVELMAVVVIIGVLVAVVIGTAKYANFRIGIAQAKTQLAALQMGIELYKADVGYYPASTIVRFSYSGSAEISNSACLYRALTQPKRYYNARRSDIGAAGVFTYFKDPWGTPWHYYRPVPAQLTSFLASINAANASYYITNGNYASFAVGGQKNSLTYDLYSYGPDTITTIPGSIGAGSGSPFYYAWQVNDQTTSGHDTDDIVNWK